MDDLSHNGPKIQSSYKAYLRQQAEQELAQLQQQGQQAVQGAVAGSGSMIDASGQAIAQGNDEQNQQLQTLAQQMLQQSLMRRQQQLTSGASAGMDNGSAYDPSLIGENIGGSMLSQPGPITETPGQFQPGVEVFSHGMTNGLGVGVPTGTKAAVPQGQWQVVQSFAGARNGYIGDGENSGYGNSVLVKNAQTGEMLRYSHLSKVAVQPGQTLKGGQVLGATGATGNVTGPHLNLEYYTPQGTIGNVLKSPYAQSLGLNQGKAKGKGGGNPLLQAAQGFYKGFTEQPQDDQSSFGTPESFGNFIANGTPAGEATSMLGHGANIALNTMQALQHAAPIAQGIGVLPIMAGATKALHSPNAYAIHPEDQKILTNIVGKMQAGMSISPDENYTLQTLSDHYLGKNYANAGTPTIGKAFDYFLAKQNGGIPGKLPRPR